MREKTAEHVWCFRYSKMNNPSENRQNMNKYFTYREYTDSK